jgi:hypothetical protein
MKKELELTIPTDWAGVNLKKYLALRADMETYKDDEEAITAVILMHLCGLEPTYLQSLPVDVYNDIKDTIAQFINNVELPLQKFINIDGIEYGFEPNLSKMAYGAYADITKHKTLEINSDWASIMNILYRPVKHKKGSMYEIEKYTGNTDSDKFLNVGMDVHFGTLFFLLNLLMDLLNSTLNSTKGLENHPNIKSILEKNGQLIRQSLNLLKETSPKLIL